ncbi:MAG: zinc-dependent alcohol dehydrogenase [Promethearchaeota archaeon]
MISIRAAVFEDIKKISYREDYPDPVQGPEEALVKVHYCGICGSDVSNFKYKIYQVPLIMGHEFSGEVVKLGEKMKDFQVGDRVMGINIVKEKGYGDTKALGIMVDGAFAEYVSVPRDFLFHAPENVSLKECTLIESYAVAIRAMKLSNIRENERVFIIGGGNIGLTTLDTLISERNPEYIGVIEPHEFLREKAKEMGANEAFPPVMSKIKRYMKKNGEPTFIFLSANNESTIEMAINLIKKGGSIILESVFKGNVSLPIFMFNSKEIGLKGVISHERKDVLSAIDLFKEKKVHPEKLISKVISLKEIQEGFNQYLKAGERDFVKILVKI